MWDVRETGQQEVGEAAVIPVLVKAVQELSTQVDELKAEITTLKGE
jgi:cell division protein FtsB